MRIEAIAIGSELLTTRRVDTNSVWLGERLAGLGLAFHRKTCVGDNRGDLFALCWEALERSDVVLCTGGLGPTFDDFTKEVFAEVAGVDMVEDARAREELLAWYAQRGRTPSENNFKQVQFPYGAEPLRNPLGTAPGVWWEDPPGHRGRTVILLPGVPREMQRLWLDHVEPRLRARAGKQVHSLRVVVAGVPESTLDERTQEVRARHGRLEWIILASLTQVELQARHQDPDALAAAEADLRDLLGADLVGVGEANLEDAVLLALAARGESLALAESMTGGLLAARLTAIPGASSVLLGGAVVYTPKAKMALTGMDPACLEEHGSLGGATTLALARGIRERLGATWGLAVTGNAGPTVDLRGKDAEIGSTTLALVGPGVEETSTFVMPGDRADIQLRAAARGMDFLRRKLGHGK
jgi:nicotinamide-nucleotide amidase